MRLELLKVALLFALTAVAEIVGCYLPWLIVKQHKSIWLLIPAAFSLALFAWLLTLHPSAAGRTYAAYGGMYITVALLLASLRGWSGADALGCGRRVRRLDRHVHHRAAAHDECLSVGVSHAEAPQSEDITGVLDVSLGSWALQKQHRVNVDFPTWMIESLDREAGRMGVTRHSAIKV